NDGGGSGGGSGGSHGGNGGGGGAVGGSGGAPQVLSWSAATNVEMDPITGSYWPACAIDPTHGNVLVAWTKGDFPAVKRWDATKKMWGATKILDDRGSVQGAAVAMDDVGHALVVWYQVDNNDPPADVKGIWFSHSEDGGVTWSAATRIHQGPAWGDVALAIASDGQARVAWDETDGTTRSLWSASYSPATKVFAGAAVVKTGSDAYERHARMAMSPKGAGLLVWIQRDGGGHDSVWGSSFATPGGALTTPVLVDANTTSDVYDATVAISADGTRGTVGWDQAPSTSDEIWTADWTSAGFATATRAVTGDGVAAPGLAVDGNYTVTMAWSQMFASGKWNVVASRRPTGAMWGTATPLETTNMAGSFTDQYAYPQAQSDAAGNVHVLWRRKIDAGNTYGVVVRRYSNATWEPEVVLGTKKGLEAFNEMLAVGADGHAAASFFYGDPDGVGDADAHQVFVALYK
ncbi:MAG TPA: hypothetical protein VHJ20_15085, partial [Polyangia bacterium]|nr:hypothetical protein [Polyangia bacterium]